MAPNYQHQPVRINVRTDLTRNRLYTTLFHNSIPSTLGNGDINHVGPRIVYDPRTQLERNNKNLVERFGRPLSAKTRRNNRVVQPIIYPSYKQMDTLHKKFSKQQHVEST